MAILAGGLSFATLKLQVEVVDLGRRLPLDLAALKRNLAGSPVGGLLDQAIVALVSVRVLYLGDDLAAEAEAERHDREEASRRRRPAQRRTEAKRNGR